MSDQGLPEGWVAVPSLHAVCSLITDGTHHSPTNLPTGSHRYVTAKNIRPWGLDLSDISYVSDQDHEEIYARCPVAKDDVLYIKDGVTAGLAAVNPLEEPFSMLSSVALLRPNRQVLDPFFLKYWLNSPDTFVRMTAGMTGSAIKRLVLSQIRNTSIDIPPLPEQKRIVARLDTLLGRLGECQARLDRVPALLKRFRQSVLAAATSGRLTEDWREEKDDQPKWPKRRLLDIGSLGRGKSKHRPRNDPRLFGGPYPFIQTGDVARSRGRIVKHEQTYSEFGLSQSLLWPKDTLCITIAANIADTAILSYPACFPDSVVGFVSEPGESVPEFVKYLIETISSDLETYAPATAQKNINLEILEAVEFECPAYDEQLEIVRRVESLFALADRIEARYQAAKAKVDRLQPAVLAKAFRGELVAQDPNDEPASALLERVKVSLTAETVQSRRGRKPR